jgi:uncharacterized phiE125 gp8 family phage protein
MAALVVETPPNTEPVSLDEAKNFLRVTNDNDNDLITGLIVAAREYCEMFTSRSFVNKGYRQSLDAPPYFTDSMVSQQSYPPAYYALPQYATTLWNYSQMIKLMRSPVVSVDSIKYTDTNNAEQTLSAGSDFVVDTDSEPGRIFPKPGQYWPPVAYVPNAFRIHFTAGFGDDSSDVPQCVRAAMLQLIGNWNENREASSPLTLREIPYHVEALLWSQRVVDFSPTRG